MTNISDSIMLKVVLILNLLIAGLCWYVVWRVWQLRCALSRVTNALVVAERSTHRVLYRAPEAILQGQSNTYQLRYQYQQVLLQIQQVRQILTLLGLGQVIWRQYRNSWQLSARKQQSPKLQRIRKRRLTLF